MLNSKMVKGERNEKRKIAPIKMLSDLVGCLKNVQACLTMMCPNRQLQILSSHPTRAANQKNKKQKKTCSMFIYELGHLKQIYSLAVLDAEV